MGQAINYISICAALGVVIWRYFKDYQSGLRAAVFMLLLLPDRLSIETPIVLPSLTVHRLIVTVALIAWMKNSRIEKRLRGIPFIRILGMIAAAYLVSTLLSSYFLVSAKRYLYFFVEYLLCFVIIQTSMRDRKTLERLLRTVGWSLLCVALVGVVERRTGLRVLDHLPRSTHAYEFETLAHRTALSDRGITATYSHRILYGIACALCVAKHFLDVSGTRNLRRTLTAWLGALAGFASLYYSMSRGPWLAFALAIALLTMAFPRRLFAKTTFLFLAIAAVFIVRPGVLIAIEGLGRDTLDDSTLKGSSFRWRFTIWRLAAERISSADAARFLFGFGGGSHIFLDFGEAELSTGRIVTVESWDSELAVNLFEQGVVGMSLIAWLYASVCWRAFRYVKSNRPQADAMMFVLASILILVISKASVRIFAPQLVYAEALVLAVASALLQAGRDDTQ